MVDAAHGEEAEEQAGQEECSVGGDHMVDVWLEFGSADSGLHGCTFLSSSGGVGGLLSVGILLPLMTIYVIGVKTK